MPDVGVSGGALVGNWFGFRRAYVSFFLVDVCFFALGVSLVRIGGLVFRTTNWSAVEEGDWASFSGVYQHVYIVRGSDSDVEDLVTCYFVCVSVTVCANRFYVDVVGFFGFDEDWYQDSSYGWQYRVDIWND